MQAKRVSVIVCVRNGGGNFRECLQSVTRNRPTELIVVDGGSTDGTISVAAEFADHILSDDGRGLGNARNIGMDKATGDFLFFVGPDNVLPDNTLQECLQCLMERGWSGVAPCTRIRRPRSYFEKTTDTLNQARFFPGKRDVIGTPWMYRGDVLRRYRFDPRLAWSDDTDLCYRLGEDGLTVGMASVVVYDVSPCTGPEIWSRWKNYGVSDSQFHSKYYESWNRLRKTKSMFHPIYSCLFQPLMSERLKFFSKLRCIPFLCFILLARYVGWVQYHGKDKQSAVS